MGEAGGAAGEGNKFTADLMDQFFRDPNMQQLLYKYLPEPMRNPQTFEWMLSNPEYRKQLEAMMEQQVRTHHLPAEGTHQTKPTHSKHWEQHAYKTPKAYTFCRRQRSIPI